MKNSRLKILPVIHHIDERLSLEQADLALALGADGIFLISHQQNDDPLTSLARVIRWRHPAARIGVNLLSSRLDDAFDHVVDRGAPVVDALWADNADVDSSGPGPMANEVAAAIVLLKRPMKLFASVAFKYQRPEPDPAAAAVAAAKLGFIPTTSGQGTGVAPAIEKIATMRRAIGPDAPLAVASGMTPGNIAEFAPYLSHVLVATGISSDKHHFDARKLLEFVAAARAAKKTKPIC